MNPNRKLTKQEVIRFCNESRLRLAYISTTNYDFEPIVASCEHALNEAADLPQAYLSGYTHQPDFMGVDIPLVWDVSKLLETDTPVTTKAVPVTYLRSLMTPEIFDDPYGQSFSRGPIILAELPFCLPNACIRDGNHRVLDAVRNGVATLPTKLYYDHDHIKFMSPYSKVLFGACCNIFYASLLVESKISLDEFENLSFELA